MAFSSDLAKLVSGTLSRFVQALNRHQLAGQVANLDFWITQIRNALDVIDRYGERFVRMNAAQDQYVNTHDTKEFNLKSEFSELSTAKLPRRVPDRELQAARKELTKVTSVF